MPRPDTLSRLRTFKSASASLQRMIAHDLASFDTKGTPDLFTNRAAALRRSIADDRYPTDCAWPGVEMADIASLYELVADEAAQMKDAA